MVQIRKFLVSSFIALTITTCTTVAKRKPLSTNRYKAASVLPTYTHRNKKYTILAREVYGTSRGTYDDFGGGREKGENDPLTTATREFSEEGIVNNSLGLTLKETRDFIANNTQHIIAYVRAKRTNDVIYIIDFHQYKSQFLDNFYSARNKTTRPECKEKDRIAIVEWSAVKDGINNQPNKRKPVKVYASVLNPMTKKFEKKLITFRSSFVSKMRGFFLDRPYKQDINKKIRFYETR